MIRALVLDYGGVLSAAQGAAERQTMTGILGVGDESFHGAYWEHRAAYDRGDLHAAGYWAAVCETLGVPWTADSLVDLVRADAAGWGHLDPRMIAWARDVAARVPTALLSNMPHDVKDALLPTISTILPWAATLFSCDAGVVKPDAAIYLRCAELLGFDPSEVAMVDDRPDNVAGAERAGMRGVLFTTPEALRDVIDLLLATSEAVGR